MIQKRCSKCGKVKPVTEFYKNRTSKDGLRFWCKECCRQYDRESYKKNREKRLNYVKNYYKQHRENILRYNRERYWKNREKILAEQRRKVLTTSNNQFRELDKRPWTGYCELCGRSNIKQLSYHHWDDKNPSKGIWVCNSCHLMVTAYENGKFAYLQKYLRLKRFLNKQYKIKENLKPEQN